MLGEQAGMIVAPAVTIAICVIMIVYYVFQVIAGWKIFTKAGEKGWKSLIPIYNLVVQYKLTWKPAMVIPVVVLPILFGFTHLFPDSLALAIIGGVVGIVSSVCYLIGLSKLSKAFGKGGGFTVGLIFLYPIFSIILGFGKAEYVGNTTEMKASE